LPPPDQSDFREGIPFLGGALWIDVLNTTPVMGGQRLDLIGDPERLATWLRLAGVACGAPPSPADVADAQALREILRPVLDGLTTGAPVPGQVVHAVNAVLRRVAVVRQLAQDGALRLTEDVTLQTGPLTAAVALDFARFVTGGHDAARLRHCSNPTCTMVFYDLGKNNRRRWCSMQACGNRSKVASYRQRHALRDT
jgi:predicted RNA-binding Zn ribbon-like protein